MQLTGEADVAQLDYAGDGPIVVVGGTNDPATPIRWAEEMTAAMGPNARMVTFTGEGHGQLLASTCVTDIEAALLADLDAARRGHRVRPRPAGGAAQLVGRRCAVPGEFSDVDSCPPSTAALGLTDTLGYGETRTTTLRLDAAADAVERGARPTPASRTLGNQDLGIDDTIETGYFTPDGELLIVIVHGAGGLRHRRPGQCEADRARRQDRGAATSTCRSDRTRPWPSAPSPARHLGRRHLAGLRADRLPQLGAQPIGVRAAAGRWPPPRPRSCRPARPATAGP